MIGNKSREYIPLSQAKQAKTYMPALLKLLKTTKYNLHKIVKFKLFGGQIIS
tara:strand:- start:36 stop:191 length:156 start_codon:yes stop_codon:yes gene_type:complete